jgi:hypothetical protein
MSPSTSKRIAALFAGVALFAALPATAGSAAKPKAKAKVTLVTTPFALPGPTPDVADALAACPAGTTLLGGGAVANTPPPAPPHQDVEIFKSGPSGNSWAVRYDNDAGIPLMPSAQAICLKNKLKVTGAEGKPKAVSRVTQVNTAFTIPSDSSGDGHVQFDVACPAGTTVAGGGASFTATAPGTDIRLEESGPQGNGWHVRYDNDDTPADTGIATAMCLKNKLKVKGGTGKAKARSKIQQVTQPVSLPPSGVNDGRARFDLACPSGTTVVGGGAKIDPAAPLATTDIQLEESGQQGNGWRVLLENDETAGQSASIHALCLKNKLKVK